MLKGHWPTLNSVVEAVIHLEIVNSLKSIFFVLLNRNKSETNLLQLTEIWYTERTEALSISVSTRRVAHVKGYEKKGMEIDFVHQK